MSLLAHTHWSILTNVTWGCLAVAMAVACVRLQWLLMADLRRSCRRWRQERDARREYRE